MPPLFIPGPFLFAKPFFGTRGHQACGAGSRSRPASTRSVHPDPSVAMTEVTRILSAIEQGDPHAAERLLPLVYDELRKLAAARMAEERADHTLQPTALVHEAYLRLVEGAAPGQAWDSRGHFFAACAEAMRRILVDAARARAARKRGGAWKRI